MEPGGAAGRSTHRHADQAAQHTLACGKLKHSHGHFSVSIWGWSKLSAARHCTQRSATMRGPSTPVCVALAGRGSTATSCPGCRARSSPHKMQVLIHPPKSQQGSKGFRKTKCRKTLQAASHPWSNSCPLPLICHCLRENLGRQNRTVLPGITYSKPVSG